MKENFSKGIQRLLEKAKKQAISFGHSYIGSEHFLLGIINDSKGNAHRMLNDLNCDIKEMKNMILDLAKPNDATINIGHLPLTRRTERILRNTYINAQNMEKDIATQEHLLLAMLEENEGVANDVFSAFSIKYNDVYKNVEKKNKLLISNEVQSKTPLLDSFSRDISQSAKNNKIDPIIGREIEIERLAQILCRRKKNNPALIGEPGVGKTAVVEGLAQRINNKTVPRLLWGKVIKALDLPALIAGTKYRGQFEERMRTLILELEGNNHCIVFIDG